MFACLGALIIGSTVGVRSDMVVPLARVMLITAAAIAVIAASKKLRARFLEEKSSPVSLAMARITIMGLLLANVDLRSTLTYASLNKALLFAPLGWRHIAPHLPNSPELLKFLYGIFVASSVLAIAGLWGRVSCLLAGLTAFYLMTFPQLYGKVNHTHHLILFAGVLALSPCCDALSIDALWKRRSRRGSHPGLNWGSSSAGKFSWQSRSRAYAVPLQIMMITMGLIYFFPGAWKISRSGLAWFSADSLRGLIAQTLPTLDRTPLQLWVLHHNWMLFCGSVFTIVFEVGFLFAVLNKKTRPLAVVVGLGFHNFTFLLLGIHFIVLQLCYVIFVPWDSVFAAASAWLRKYRPPKLDWESTLREHAATGPKAPPVSQARLTLQPALYLYAGVMLSGMVLAGLSHTVNSWPIACYPTFDKPMTGRLQTLSIAYLDDANGLRTEDLEQDAALQRLLSPERYHVEALLMAQENPGYSKERAVAFTQLWEDEHQYSGLRQVVFYREEYRVGGAGRAGQKLSSAPIGTLTRSDGLR